MNVELDQQCVRMDGMESQLEARFKGVSDKVGNMVSKIRGEITIQNIKKNEEIMDGFR